MIVTFIFIQVLNTTMYKTIYLSKYNIFYVFVSLLINGGAAINGKVTNLRVRTQDGHICDFDNWYRGSPGVFGLPRWPVTGHSCTVGWKEKKREVTRARSGIVTVSNQARWPWCDFDGYNWDWCIGYEWTYSTNTPLGGPKISTYDFNYYNYGKNYWRAEQMCRSHGKGWDVATFNKRLTIEGNDILRNNNYKISVEHIRQAIRPLEATIEQKGAFWVKYINENQCLKWTGSEIAIANCGKKFSVVCQ